MEAISGRGRGRPEASQRRLLRRTIERLGNPNGSASAMTRYRSSAAHSSACQWFESTGDHHCTAKTDSANHGSKQMTVGRHFGDKKTYPVLGQSPQKRLCSLQRERNPQHGSIPSNKVTGILTWSCLTSTLSKRKDGFHEKSSRPSYSISVLFEPKHTTQRNARASTTTNRCSDSDQRGREKGARSKGEWVHPTGFHSEN